MHVASRVYSVTPGLKTRFTPPGRRNCISAAVSRNSHSELFFIIKLLFTLGASVTIHARLAEGYAFYTGV